MQIVDAPAWLDRRLRQSWWLDAGNVSGGQPTYGRPQVITPPLPIWRCTIGVLIQGGAQMKSVRAFFAGLRGRAGAVRVRPMCCVPDAMYARLGAPGITSRSVVRYSDGASHSDGSGFAAPVPMFVTAAQALPFSDMVSLSVAPYLPALVDGDYIGIAGRLHIVCGVEAVDATHQRVRVAPPFPVTVPAGAPVTILPSVVMSPTEDSIGQFERSASPVVDLTLNFEQIPDAT